MRITKGQLVIDVKETSEGYLASVNKKYICGCTGFPYPTVMEAIESALVYFEMCSEIEYAY